MSKNNLANLQAVLSAKSTPKPSVAPNSAAKQEGKAAEPVASPANNFYKAPSREGKVNITAYLSPDFKSNLRLIQARTGVSLQSLIVEALNDLFLKYDVPTINSD